MQKKMSPYPRTINHSLSRNFFGLKQSTWLWVLLAIGISLILATRQIYIARDDENYLNYFLAIDDGFSNLNDDWWHFVLEEPLWRLYASNMGNIFGVVHALRITIFFSSLMFIVASGNITRGAWLFVFLVFVIDDCLASQMYYNQIRQGLALSIFLTIIAIGLSPFWGAVVASLVHSSFLLVIPFYLMSLVIKKFNVSWVIVITVVIISTYLIKSVAPDLDFGRRTDIYELKGKLNIFSYLVAGFQFGSVFLFFFRQKYFYDETQLVWLNFSLFFFIVAICLTMIHEEAGRMMYLERAFMMIVIGMNFERKRVKIIALFWLLFLFAGDINEARKVSSNDDTFFDRWSLILNVK
jgi:EpsG family